MNEFEIEILKTLKHIDLGIWVLFAMAVVCIVLLTLILLAEMKRY